MYKLKPETMKNINYMFEKSLGITYDEYAKLDCDEQERLMSEYHKKNKGSKSDEVIAMIGSGENAIFTRVKKGETIMIGSGEDSCFVRAGITPEEARRELDDQIDDALYSKPVAFARKLQRRLKRK